METPLDEKLRRKKYCQIRKGFFTLKPCGEKAFSLCADCGKEVCPKHSQQDTSSKVRCVECAGKMQHQARTINPQAPKNDVFDDLWYFNMRANHYNTYHYRPYFDDNDEKGFDKTHNDQTDNDLDDNNDAFFDS